MSKLLEAGALMLKAGLSVLPTDERKACTLKTWKPLQEKPLTEEELSRALSNPSAKAIGIVCGAVSGGLEVIDVDTKYDLTGRLEDELLQLIDPELLEKLVIARTISGGLHIYYRAPKVSGNKKLATRYTTAEELKKNPYEKQKGLIETRGEAGYILAPPSTGYSYIQGDYNTIPTITEEDRSYLLNVAKSFNEVEEEVSTIKTPTTKNSYNSGDLSPFEDFNLNGQRDAISLLEAVLGWTIKGESSERIYLKRSGETSSKYSANYHKQLKKLWVFSTWAGLPTDKALSNSDIFLQLECNGDTKEGYKKLRAMGYGTAIPATTNLQGQPTANPEENDKGFTDQEEEEFSRLLEPLTRERIREEILKEKENLPTGFYLRDQDRTIELKIPSGALTVISGRTSHRKTGTMLNLTKQVSDRIKDRDGKILFLSYEESSTNIQLKLFNLIANIESLDPTGELDNKDYIKAYYKGQLEGSKEFKEAEEDFYREYIDSKRIVVHYTNYKDKRLGRAVRWLASKDSYTAIFIDYLQLIRPEELSSKPRQEQLFNICEELREVAIETKVPLIFGAQFNREVQERTDLDSSKIREAGDIEQTANLVLGLWDNNFNPDGEKVKKDKEGNAKTPPRENSLYIEVLKGRDIGIGWKETFEYSPPTGAIALRDPDLKKRTKKK